MDIATQIKKFVEPESVAIIGVSRTPMTIGSAAMDVLSNLTGCGYQGNIYPVHPRAGEIQGLKTYSSVAELPENIDLAVINLPRNLVPGVVKECISRGIKAIIIITQGFTDADDEEGKRLQREIDDIVRGTDTRILGPNTLGTANAYVNFSSAFGKIQMEKIPVGFMCQTGVFFGGSPNWHFIGKVIDVGNASDVSFSDGLEYYEQDDETRVIGLHIEGMKDAARFLKTARRVGRKKPIVALKTGRSERAIQAAQSHTGSLVGKREIWDAALKQVGVVRVNDAEELADTVKAFYTLPLMKGRKVGVITYSGGFGIMSIDACEKHGLEVARLSPETINRLSPLYPSWQKAGNPADIWPATMVEAKKISLSEVLEIVTNALLDDPGVDAILFMLYDIVTAVFATELNKIIEKAVKSHPDKPLVFYFYGVFGAEAVGEFESQGRTVAFPGPVRAIRALGHLADYSEFRMRY